ncbi:PQ-loop-domain-containing protein [Terfezia boudieri ATCC MYA-4762]|uniref:PQ-loop-domain-containing protein n=1 Tax=Terfezia boudieri ATCC MYA-4762 TaxID=1051890 RepID=A0A3N4LU17_9PEZI|nr:PQ-loop-domain-containing protein [Terfezia boudieri ATCC MYA-4762]
MDPSPLPQFCSPAAPYLVNLSIFFGTCIPSQLSLISSVLGLCSISAWLFSQIPQVIKNYRNRSVEGLSALFLLNWFLGDICNFLGTVILNQMFFQKAIGAYYVTVDFALMLQFIWYGVFVMTGKKASGYSALDVVVTDSDDSGDRERKGVPVVIHGVSLSPPESPSNSLMGSYASGGAAVALEPVQISRSGDWISIDTLGKILSWVSTSLYCTSRLPQLYKNYTRRTTAGLSIMLFVAAFFGNLFYSLSLLTNPLGWADYEPYGGGGIAGPEGSKRSEWWANTLPFFMGASGVLCQDAMVYVQYLWWGDEEKVEELSDEVVVPVKKSLETQRLLGGLGRTYGAVGSK